MVVNPSWIKHQKNRIKFILPVFFIITALAAIAGAVLWLAGRGEEGQRIYEKAPNFLWLDLEDKPAVLEAYRGKIVVVNFWAGWCVWCVREMPVLEKLYQEFRDRGLVVLGIHRTDTETIEVGKSCRGARLTHQLLKDLQGAPFVFLRRARRSCRLRPLSRGEILRGRTLRKANFRFCFKYSCGETWSLGDGRHRRAQPSGGARFPIEVYPIVFRNGLGEVGLPDSPGLASGAEAKFGPSEPVPNRVSFRRNSVWDGIKAGLYHYNIKDHSLDVLWDHEFSDQEINNLFSYPWIKDAWGALVMTAVFLDNPK